MSEFIKTGDKIVCKPQGLDYQLEAGKVYDLCYDDYNNVSYLKENGELNLPNKLYTTDIDDNFINRVLVSHTNSSNNTTGVLLYGNKGTGKSICAKRIAKESNLPIIIVSDNYYASWLIYFFKQFKQEVCIIFDELEKNMRYWDTRQILKFLDGIESTCKKLVLFTCNEIDNLDDNLFDRCSRIRYIREYTYDDNREIINLIAKERNISEKDLAYIYKTVKVLSIDNCISIFNEMEMFPTLPIEEIIKYMNITENSSGNKINENNILDENHIFDAPF